MLLELFLAIFIGIFMGIITGLAPGIHINLVGSILLGLVASTPFFSVVPAIYLVCFVTALAITHTFIDFIPSIFLGAPEDDGGALSVLPGHQLLKEGKGFEAVLLTAYGGLFALIILIATTPIFLFTLPTIYSSIKFLIPYLLIIVCLFLILSEKNKFSAFLVITLTGILGLCVLNLELNEPLLPMLGGLFGSASLLLSLKNKTEIPKQNFENIKINKKELIKPLIGAGIASPLCGFLPGLGSGQAAIIGSQFIKTDNRDFLALLGAVNILVMAFSFVSLYSISKIRTGAAATIDNLIGKFDLKILILIIVVVLISGLVSFFLTKILSKFFLKIIGRFNYAKLSKGVLVFISLIVLGVSGFTGFIIFIISTFTGYYCISLGVKRTLMMGCLLIPTIILYLI